MWNTLQYILLKLSNGMKQFNQVFREDIYPSEGTMKVLLHWIGEMDKTCHDHMYDITQCYSAEVWLFPAWSF